MWIAVSVAMAAATFGAALVTTRAARRRPFPVAALVAFAAVLAFETVALDVLSELRAVTRPGVLAAHAIAIAIVIAVRRRTVLDDAARAVRRAIRSFAALGVAGLLMAPLAGLIAASALRFAPNNWDSMTYHLARVAHWIQQRSVEPYPTHIHRQVLLMPGAEYLIATLQVVSGSDRLASLVQLASWLLVVLASPSLARLAGAPRAAAPWAAVIAGSAPMMVLQASSTQNDLVAAALALGAWATCAPFVHRAPRAWRRRDVVLLAMVLSAAAIVKISAVVVAAPMLAVAAVRVLGALRGAADVRKLMVAVAGAAVVFAAVVGPEIARRSDSTASRGMSGYASTYLYPPFGDLAGRARNLACGVVRHVPLPRGGVAACGIDAESWCRLGDALCGAVLSRAHEDYAGNPLQVVIAALAGALLVVSRRRAPARALLFLACGAAAWILFFLVFRDNAWISRLETPTFALSGTSLAALGTVGRDARRRAHAAAVVIALAALAHGTALASWNETRPPLADWVDDRDVTYYANQPRTRQVHDVVLAAARYFGCSRLGLMIGGDSYDYPLTWRAMQAGIEVRHIFEDEAWPCLVFTDIRSPPALLTTARWIRTSVPFLYVKADAVRR